MKDETIHIYANGMVHCSVCVPKEMSRKQIEKQVNLNNPTGISSNWTISKAAFKDSDKNPLPCDNDKNRLHYLMVC